MQLLGHFLTEGGVLWDFRAMSLDRPHQRWRNARKGRDKCGVPRFVWLLVELGIPHAPEYAHEIAHYCSMAMDAAKSGNAEAAIEHLMIARNRLEEFTDKFNTTN